MYTLQYDERVIADIKRLDKQVQTQIKKAVASKLLTNPAVYGKPLQYDLAGARTFRVGDYRVVFDLLETVVFIWLISHRKDVYRLASKRIT
jgi:mRNA interferase RelE/StbE